MVEWWNGKKTIIGAIALFVAESFIGGLLINELGFSPDWLIVAQKIGFWIGTVLVPVGLAHKGVKKMAA